MQKNISKFNNRKIHSNTNEAVLFSLKFLNVGKKFTATFIKVAIGIVVTMTFQIPYCNAAQGQESTNTLTTLNKLHFLESQSKQANTKKILSKNDSLVEDSYPNKIALILKSINAQRANYSDYTLKLDDSNQIASTVVWETIRNSRTGEKTARHTCQISINSDRLEELRLSDDSMAFIIGHELAHCENEKFIANGEGPSPKESWDREYQADLLGAIMATAAGYNAYQGMRDLGEKIASKGSSSHPSTEKRIAKLVASLRPAD